MSLRSAEWIEHINAAFGELIDYELPLRRPAYFCIVV